MCKTLTKHCPVCNRELDENEDLVEVGKGAEKQYMCEECYEVDDTPTSSICDQCGNPSYVCYNGTNLCEDCEEHYHY